MAENKITPILCKEVKNYSNEKVTNFWQKKESSLYSPNIANNSWLFWDKQKHIIDTIRSAQKTIFIQSEYLNSEEIIKVCFQMASKVRIYIIVNNLSQHEQVNSLALLAGSCLIRHGFSASGTFILIDANINEREGLFFTAPLNEVSIQSDKNLLINLDIAQIKELYQYFCNNFWHHCRYEVINKSDIQNFRETLCAPIDILPTNKFTDSKFVFQKLASMMENSSKNNCIYLPQIRPLLYTEDIKKMTNTTVVTSLADNYAKVLKLLVNNDNTVYSFSETIPYHCWLSNNEGYLLPIIYTTENDNLYALQLNDGQRELVQKFFDHVLTCTNYQFHSQKKRSKILTPICLLENIQEEITIRQEESIALGNIHTHEILGSEELKNSKPISFPDPLFSCKVTYSWTVHPTYLPEKARQDKLYNHWEEVKDKFQKKIDKVENGALEIEKSKGNLGERILGSLKSMFIGKTREINEIRSELEKLLIV